MKSVFHGNPFLTLWSVVCESLHSKAGLRIPTRFQSLALALFMLFGISAANAATTCVGKFFNPITDVCWSCVFPLKLGGSDMLTMGQEDFKTDVNNPLCACGIPPKVGVSISFWEPARIVEAVRKPYCFTSLGGVTIDPGVDAPAHAQEKNGKSFYQMHWYISPLLFWLEVIMDDPCLEQGVFDLAYMTELDPLWSDSELTFLLNPDAVLFANPLAQAACSADCVAATAGFPLNTLFWCAGCQGSMYPLDGWVGSHVGGVQASTLLMQRMINKMHRELLIWGAHGKEGMCSFYPIPIMDKRAYKTQMLYPIPNTKKENGRCCSTLGRSTVISGAGKEFPYKGEDFAYMLYRRRDCCQGAIGLGTFK
ncbi:MAG: TraU family protein [Methylophilaceae bacterium]|nr:TraU family protein [Methylophilaceae bacterium]